METPLTDLEQRIYNTHLRISRSINNLPYKLRKDFSNIKDVEINSLKKLSIFFAKFPHIKLEDFVIAPFKIYSDEKYFGLDYYTTLKATKAYTLYQKQLETMDPDTDSQLKSIIDSLKFISIFSTEQNISIDDYIKHQSNTTPSYILHLKEHRINVYTLFGFSSFERHLRSYDSDLLKFILGDDFLNNLSSFRLKFFTSKKAKKLVELGLQKIKNKKTT